MKLKKYEGLDYKGDVIRWTTDINPDSALDFWKKDARVVKITEDGKRIWKR